MDKCRKAEYWWPDKGKHVLPLWIWWMAVVACFMIGVIALG